MKAFPFLILAASLVLAPSCAKKSNLNPEDGAETPYNHSGARDSDSGNANGLKTVYFEYDSSDLGPGGKADLRHNAALLKQSPNLHVQIEGHCDERGGIQYNLALGERRAKAAQRYLSEQGVKASRIAIISYGKERPVASGDQDSDHAKNRRGNFVITGE